MAYRPIFRILGVAVTATFGLGCVTMAGADPDGRVPTVEAYRDVAGQRVEYQGREALALELTSEEQAQQLAGAGGNRPTFALLPGEFRDGVIEVDVAAELNGRGGPDARGFVGVVFRLGEDERFESVYLRMSNGTLNRPAPPAPRDVRAIQYIAHPEFHFPVSRAEAPGIYERAAPVAVGRWHRLRLEITGTRLVASVDGETVLELNDLRLVRPGRLGLWVGDGTRAYFSNLKVKVAVVRQ